MNGKLIVSEGGRERVHELLDDVTIVGRGATADLRLKDPKAAAAHCEIRRSPQGFRLVDRETREGTAVNGRLVNAHLLRQGDVVKIGDVEIAFLGDSAPEAAEAPKSPALRKGAPTEDGPKRYRNDAPVRRGGDPAVKALVALIVLGLGGVAAWAVYRSKNDASVLNFHAAESRLGSVDSEEAVREILGLLDKVEPGKIDPRRIGRVRSDAKEKLAYFVGERRANEETAAWNKVVQLYSSSPDAAAEIVTLCDDYLSRYPESGRKSEVQRMKTRARLGGDPESLWDHLMRDVNVAIREKRFADAYEAFDKFGENQPVRQELGARYDSGRRTLDDKYGQFVTERFQAAQAAVARGDVQAARDIYGEIVRRNIKPHAENARLALEALQ